MKRFLGWGYLVFLLAALSCGSVTAFAGEAPQSSDCGLKQLASIDLDIGTYVLMPVTIDGTPARMGLTTSSGISSISKRDANAMGIAISKAPPSLIGTLGIATINSFSGPERSAEYADCLGSVPLTLGLDVLQHLRLYFATKEHILYFTAADAGMPAGVGAQ